MTTTDSPQPSTDRLALLYRLSQTFNSSLYLDEVLNRVMDEVIAATHAERGFLMLHEADGKLAFHAARGMDQGTIHDPQFQISRGLVERVACEGEAVLTSDAQADERFRMRESVLSLQLRSILCVPLIIQGQTIGVIYVDNRLRAGIFTQADLELLTSIASSAAVAVENARLYRVAVEKGRLERDLQLAHKVQASLLPRETPQIAGWDFDARWQPAREMSGDYYDFIPVTLPQRQKPAGGLGLLVADVTGKGMPAAMFMAVTRGVLRASVGLASTPAEGVARANRLICADATREMFVTLFYALLDTETGQVTYVNAGHNPPLLYRAGENRLTKLERTGLPLGVDADVSFGQGTAHLNPGDGILLYTDGVTDATNAEMNEFGMQRLEAVVLENRRAPVADLIDALEGTIEAFTGATAQFDDIAVLIAKRLTK